jgi:type IV secretion system protein TrbI
MNDHLGDPGGAIGRGSRSGSRAPFPIPCHSTPAHCRQGFAGLEDEVDHHWGKLVMAAALSTVLGIGSELGTTNNDNAIVTALRRGGTDSLNQTGQQVVRRNLNIQPTITIRPGFPVRVIVNRDLVLAPYQG